jgi:hypothetical protein
MNNIEQLLYETEGTTLDFKRAQYKFKGAANPEKADLLNDILAFANAWRRETAYILIGVEQNPGGRGIIHHIDDSDHIDDAALQQFVNEKTNRPINFRYKVIVIDSKKIGIIEIPVQKRPFFLNDRFGRLNPKVVYIRKGSSTGQADPDEVFQMGLSYIKEENTPSISVSFSSAQKEDAGSSLKLSKYRLHMIEEVSDYGVSSPLIEGDTFSLISDNRSYYRDYLRYLSEYSLLAPIRLSLTNTGSILISNVRLFIEIPKDITVLHINRKRPVKSINRIPSMMESAIPIIKSKIMKNKQAEREILQIDVGSIQPKEQVFTPMFYIGADISISQTLQVKVYADNLSNPEQVPLSLMIDVSDRNITMSDLRKMIEEDTKEEREQYEARIRERRK